MGVSEVSRGGDPAGAVSLELIGLQRRFGPVIALDGLTFGVPPGQVFGFLGPNGAGKTTAMRARGRHDAAGTIWMARIAALIYGRSILRTGSRVRLREVLGRQPAA